MGGFQFAYRKGGLIPVPSVEPYLLANSMTGAGTPPANAVQAGDLVVLTQATALTSSGNTVVRMLLAADKTAHYKEGTPVAGILGVSAWAAQSNASGVAFGPPPLGGITTSAAIPYPLSQSAMQAPDTASGRSYLGVNLFTGGNVFLARLDMAAGAITLAHQYDDTPAGVILNTTSGITNFTIQPAPTALDQCMRIIGPNEADPLYNTLVAQNAAVGPSVFVEIMPAFDQYLTAVVYTTQ